MISSSSTDSPAATPTTPETNPPAAPPPPSPPVAVSTAAQWPSWVRSADALMVLMVLAIAFLVASHAARNSDAWLHLASGRALLNGSYSFGTDPFSYTTAGQTWVNHSWLYDAVVYLIYSVNPVGAAVVAVKASLLAGCFGLLFLLRKPEQVLWPWIFCASIGVLAAAPHTGLRPLTISATFFALSLWLLFRTHWDPKSWRNPIIFALLCWFWASTDSWFILGPLTLLLALLGELGQQRFLAGQESETGSDPSISVPALGKALLLSVIACSLTPHHIRVWEIPSELGFGLPPIVREDRLFLASVLSPLNELYYKTPEIGWNWNGLAYAVLFIGSGAILTIGYARLRLTHLALWLLTAYLSLQHYRLILIFTLVAVPIAAMGLATAVSQVTLGSITAPATRIKLLASSVGRLLGIPVLGMLIAATYPGWLHPPVIHPGYAYRVAWRIDADPGLSRTAQILNGRRDAGKLNENQHGMHLSASLGDYLSWFAPGEKSYVTTRYRLHAAQLEDMVRAGRMFTSRDPNQGPNPAILEEITEKHDATYVVYATAGSPPPMIDIRPVFELTSPRIVSTDQDSPPTVYPEQFTLWHIDGRSVVLGSISREKKEPKLREQLKFDPVQLAIKDAKMMLEDPPLPTPPPAPLDDSFAYYLNPPPQQSIDGLDAIIWHQLALDRAEQRALAIRQQTSTRALSAAITGQASIMFGKQAPPPPTDPIVALQMLSLRSAFRAIAADPDAPNTYLALSGAGAAGGYFGFESQIPASELRSPEKLERAAGQFLQQLPPPDSVPPQLAGNFSETARAMSQAAFQNQNVQLGQVCREVSQMYQRRLDDIRNPLVIPGTDNEELRDLFIYSARSYLDRVPFADRIHPEVAGSVAEMAKRLAVMYREQHMLELAREVSRKALDYQKRSFLLAPSEREKEVKQLMQQLEAQAKQRDSEFTELNNQFETLVRGANTLSRLQRAATFFLGDQAANYPPPWTIPDGVNLTLQAGMPDRVIREYRQADTKDLGPDALAIAVFVAQLELRTGRAYQAAADLLQIGNTLESIKSDSSINPNMLRLVEFSYEQALERLNRLRGNYSALGMALEKQAPQRGLSPEQKALVERAVASAATWDAMVDGWLPGAMIGGSGAVIGNELARTGRTPPSAAINAWLQSASFFLARGRLLILEGKIDEAKTRFQQALKPDGISLPDFLPQREIAEQYLRMITHAEKTP